MAKEKLMLAVRIYVRNGHSGALCNLPLYADSRLHGQGRSQAGSNLVTRRRGLAVRTGVRTNDGLQLGKAVQPLRLEDEVVRETVVENSEAGTQYGFRCRLFPSASETPGKTDARSEIAMVVDVILGFKAQAKAERHVGTNPPIILSIEARV